MSPIVYFKENCFVKSIVRGGDLLERMLVQWFTFTILLMKIKKKNVYSICGRTKVSNTCTVDIQLYTGGYLKHYYTKSFDEWLLKIE